MPDFTVDIGELDTLRKNLARGADSIDGATSRLDDIGPDSIGNHELDEACDDFREDWEEGLEELREAVHAIKDGLRTAIRNYAELEVSIKTQLVKLEQELEGIGGFI